MTPGDARWVRAIALLGEVAPLVAELLPPGGDGARPQLDAAGRSVEGSTGVGRLALAAGASGEPLRDREIAPVVAWVEAQCGGPPGLIRVPMPTASTFLRVVVECDLASALRRRGRPLALIVGRGARPPAEARAIGERLMALAGQGVDTVGLASREIPPWFRRVAEPEIAPALRAAGRAGMGFAEAAFCSAEAIAAAAGVGRAEAEAIQLQLVEQALAFRGALWVGERAPLDARLAARAAALRRQGASGPAAGPPPGLPRAEGLGAVLALGADGARLELRPARLGEAVALVPVSDPVAGTSGVVPMTARAADALHPPRPPAVPARPPPSGSVGLLRWFRRGR